MSARRFFVCFIYLFINIISINITVTIMPFYCKCNSMSKPEKLSARCLYGCSSFLSQRSLIVTLIGSYNLRRLLLIFLFLFLVFFLVFLSFLLVFCWLFPCVSCLLLTSDPFLAKKRSHSKTTPDARSLITRNHSYQSQPGTVGIYRRISCVTHTHTKIALQAVEGFPAYLVDIALTSSTHPGYFSHLRLCRKFQKYINGSLF
ncbi:hypothetical protein VIN7_7391 [Saccharomyces cerevisiae x Saccharomyces kudriavzevii VIN7]|uniref:Uncharacterized protein n=1 Tax=Saccharomyces cerevisiae x Saccharomyces kudriavzevii (strain VIN7) TaxID=1095631 RepID=H0GVF1_SACCK|nr:hypothetical protein VIN7_7391 [Saccharomyces cerevisiae x Saccharomyces kudriavzevii VIN7]